MRSPEAEGDAENLNDAHYGWVALRMIRDTLQELGPAGALPSEEAVLTTRGPEMVHEAEAICEALRRILPARTGTPYD